jgi:hypothetical protein
VSTVQACVLLLFSDRRSSLTLSEMEAELELPLVDVFDEVCGLVAPMQAMLVSTAPAIWDSTFEAAVSELPSVKLSLNMAFLSTCPNSLAVHEV